MFHLKSTICYTYFFLNRRQWEKRLTHYFSILCIILQKYKSYNKKVIITIFSLRVYCILSYDEKFENDLSNRFVRNEIFCRKYWFRKLAELWSLFLIHFVSFSITRRIDQIIDRFTCTVFIVLFYFFFSWYYYKNKINTINNIALQQWNLIFYWNRF